MDENEQEKQKLVQELQWVKYRNEMLDIIDFKLLQMRAIAERVQNEALDETIKIDLNNQFTGLAIQVKEIDLESRKYEFSIY